MTTKNLLFIIIAFISLSCTAGLDRKYDMDSKEKDFIKLAEELSSEDLEILNTYISFYEDNNFSLFGYYRDILDDAKDDKAQKERKIEEGKLIKKKVELLCSKKWKMIENTFQMEMKGVGSLESKALKDLFGNDERIKIYYSDSTYTDQVGERIERGTWYFQDLNKISERRPDLPKFGRPQFSNHNIYIQILNKDTFKIIEREYESYNRESDYEIHKTMIAQ